jgi:selenocysteine-specific elongation factor
VFVIGTAGHVDHGKSTLVQALTGINPDRLREEQERQMTIDLGFAWLKLPSGREVSVVDVPGHEDFIKNMLAGVGGVDVALFVIAADESVMPQTREHLAILDLLQIPHGVVALTKSDLIEDREWLDLVREEVREQLQGTVLAQAEIIPVSAHTGDGLPQLVAELDRLLDHATPRRDLGRPRLSIDRVFPISGFGTVVTGTLLDGRLAVGEEVQILPDGLRARIRGLQTHKHKASEVEPGTRVAVNLSGVDVNDLRRGQMVTRPDWLEPTTLADAHLRVVAGLPWPLKHNSLVDFFCGAARSEAHVRLLNADELGSGQSDWVQLRLLEPVPLVRGDRYIIRLASPSLTLGGGQIMDSHPGARHRRFRPEVVARLESLSRGTPEDVLTQLLSREGLSEARELIKRSGFPAPEASEALAQLLASGQVVALDEQLPAATLLAASPLVVLSREAWQGLLTRMRAATQAYHQRYPMRAGIPREDLRNRADIPAPALTQVLERAQREGQISLIGTAVAHPDHHIALSPEQQGKVARVLAEFHAQPFTPPSAQQVEEALGADLLQHLLETGQLARVSDSVLFDAPTYALMEQRVVAYLGEHKSITVADVRDLLNTSRKYALGFLEDLDRRHITKRMGDIRVLR